jgi:UDP-glucose 4-epimerase
VHQLVGMSGVNIRVLDDLSTGSRSNLSGTDVELVEGSILDTVLLDRCMYDADSVVHLAARPSVPRSLHDPLASHSANATGTLMVLEAARKSGAYVCVASSSSVYGANTVLPKSEELACRPLSPYAVAKQAAESYALAYRHCFDMQTMAFRFFNVFGPRQSPRHAYAAVVPAFVFAALSGSELTVYGDGLQTRDFTYVGTVVAILAQAALEQIVFDLPVNLAFGTQTSLLDVIELLEQIVRRPLARRLAAPRKGDVRDSQADSAKLRSLFPNIMPTPLDVALRQTVKWMRAEYFRESGDGC